MVFGQDTAPAAAWLCMLHPQGSAKLGISLVGSAFDLLSHNDSVDHKLRCKQQKECNHQFAGHGWHWIRRQLKIAMGTITVNLPCVPLMESGLADLRWSHVYGTAHAA